MIRVNRRTKIIMALTLIPLCVLLMYSSAVWAMRSADIHAGTDLKTLGVALRMYARDHQVFPPLSTVPGRLMFSVDPLCPEYISEPAFLISYMDPARRGVELTEQFVEENSSYFYLGYKVRDDESVEAFADAYEIGMKQGTGFNSDLVVATRLLERLDEEFTNKKYPILIERPRPYPAKFGLYLGALIELSKPIIGGLVLYQDGHVKFIPYPGEWPMTKRTIETLSAIDPPV